MPSNNEPTHPPPIAPVIAGVTSAIWLRFRDMTRDRQTDRQTHRFMIWPHVVGHIINSLPTATAECETETKFSDSLNNILY